MRLLAATSFLLASCQTIPPSREAPDQTSYKAIGTEPFWSLNITDGTMIFEHAGENKVQATDYTARASFKDVSLVTFNSFETMRYNEFVQDRYVHLFISHKFSKMQVSNLPFRPYFILMHNMGWGRVSHAGNHDGIVVQAMPKGYYESGLFLNDLYVVPLFGLHLGMDHALRH